MCPLFLINSDIILRYDEGGNIVRFDAFRPAVAGSLLLSFALFASDTALSQELFWQRINIDSATEITTLASNPRGDIFAADGFGSSPAPTAQPTTVNTGICST